MRRLYRFGGLVLAFGMIGLLLAGCAYRTGSGLEPTGTNTMAEGIGAHDYVHPVHNDGDHDSDDQRGSHAQGEGHEGGFGGGGGMHDGDGDGDDGGMH